jgi:hypothetical protein
MSEQLLIGLVMLGVILVITLATILKYQAVGQVLQLWAAMGTLNGGLVTYFFTREQVKVQQAQTKFFQAAYEASEKQRANAGKQVWAVATKLKPDSASPEILQAFEQLGYVAQDLFSTKVPVARTEQPTPSAQPTQSPAEREFHDMLFRVSPKPKP